MFGSEPIFAIFAYSCTGGSPHFITTHLKKMESSSFSPMPCECRSAGGVNTVHPVVQLDLTRCLHNINLHHFQSRENHSLDFFGVSLCRESQDLNKKWKSLDLTCAPDLYPENFVELASPWLCHRPQMVNLCLILIQTNIEWLQIMLLLWASHLK